MKTPILACLSATILFGAAVATAEQQDNPTGSAVDNNAPDSVLCAQERGEPLGQCTYGIKRDKKGRTKLTVAFANGFKRSLFFRDGKFLKASMTMSGVGTDTDWTLEDGTHVIRVDGQRYEIPDSLIAEN